MDDDRLDECISSHIIRHVSILDDGLFEEASLKKLNSCRSHPFHPKIRIMMTQH